MRKLLTLLLMVFAVGTVSAAISDPGEISGLYVRLEADSFGLENGSAVTSWTDSAGGHVFTGTAAYDAYYANGHAAVYFDGVGDMLASTGWTDGPSPATVTLFVVGNFTSAETDAVSDFLISGQYPTGTTNNRFRLLKFHDDSRYQFRVGSGGTVTLTQTADTETHVFTIVAGQSAGAVSFLIDGTVLGSGSSGTVVDMQALGLGGYVVGNNQFADCSIAEVLLYDHALTAQEVADVTDYLQAKYADMTVTQTDVLTGVDATLSWDTVAEPGNYPQVNTDLIKQYVYLSDDQNVSSDPNLYYHGEGAIVSGLTSDYTANGLNYDGLYDAAVVFVMQGYDYTPTVGVSQITDVDPNNIMGPAVSFETLAQLAQITQQPVSVKVDPGLDALFTVEFTSSQAVTAAWTKDGQPVSAGNVSIVTDADSSTLTITGAASTNEGDYICTLTNIGGQTVSDVASLALKKLLAWYEFEQNADDSAGTNNGTAVPDMDYSAGLVGSYAVDPNGANYIELSTDAYPKAGFGNGLDAFTYSTWVKRGIYSGDARIFGSFNDGSTTAVQFGVSGNGTLGCYLREGDGTGTTLNTASGLVGTDEWHHIVCTFDGSRMRAYLDGLLVAEISGNPLTVFEDWQYPMVLCSRNNRGIVDQFFPAEVDDLRMYNYAFSDTEVVDTYYSVTQTAVCLNPLGLDMSFDVAGGGDLGDEPDCKVSLPDFAEFAAEWLNCGLYPVCP
jgi:hypothetical protein